MSVLRAASKALRTAKLPTKTVVPILPHRTKHDVNSPPRGNPVVIGCEPSKAPKEEAAAAALKDRSGAFLATAKRLPEFSLAGKVVLVTGAARGLGLVQAEALLEAGATVYALDRLAQPSPDFYRAQKRAAEELGRCLLCCWRARVVCWLSWLADNGVGTALHYRQIDVRDVSQLNEIVHGISESQGRIDGLIAAAGIQQETPALEYTAKDANTMFEVNV